MVIFGTIGLFVRYIPLASSMIALVRGVIGALFLLTVMLISGKRISIQALKTNLIWLALSGCALGFNWILLFESYRYTSVAISTLCYYTAPIIVILISPLLFREKLTVRNLICVVAALFGMIMISGVLQTGIPAQNELQGILYGLGAAVLYASVMLLNKQIKKIGAYDKTIIQLGISAVVLLPYCLFTVDLTQIHLDYVAIIMLVIVGVIHTGLTYFLYFGAMENVKAQTVAVLSYVDPVVAVAISALILKENVGIETLLGAVLILGSAIVSELPDKRRCERILS